MPDLTPNFCPWCGKLLPEDIPCAATCPHANTPVKFTWEHRFWIFQGYAGIVLFSVIAFYVGGGIGQLLGGEQGRIAGSSIALFLPAAVFTYIVTR